MKTLSMLVVTALAAFGTALVAQQATATAGQTTSVVASGAQVHESGDTQANVRPGSAQADGSAHANAEMRRVDMRPGDMRPVHGELVGKLDSKSAKAGDTVVVKTKETIKTADGTELPKGSRLVGHVTQVEARGSGQADSSMSIVFDRAELKNGNQLAIHSVIESVAPPASAVASDSFDAGDSLAAPSGGMHAVGGGGGRAGGALLGGAAGSTASATGGVASSLGSTTGSALHATEGATAGLGNGLHEATGASGSLTSQATGIPGVMLAGSATGSTSGTLTASRKNVHLDSGTQMVLGVAGAVSPK
jgi:hypothetical protein